MGWLSWVNQLGRKLLSEKDAIKRLVTEAADVWIWCQKAKPDGITTEEWAKIGKEAAEAGEAAYVLAKRMGWR